MEKGGVMTFRVGEGRETEEGWCESGEDEKVMEVRYVGDVTVSLGE